MNECYVNEISVYGQTNMADQNILAFDFPFLTLTMDDLKANAGEPNEKPYHNEDDPSFVPDYLKWSKKGTKYMNYNYYNFQFYNGKLRNFYMTYIP